MTKYFDIPFLKRAYAQGENVSQLMRQAICSKVNTKEIIETSYDLQAGSYIESYNKSPFFAQEYCKEKSTFIKNHFPTATTLIDCGCGELTATSLAHFTHLSSQIKRFYAFDISWSRLYKGIQFYKKKTGHTLECFTADMEHIPLPDNSIDVVTTSHSLEPNHGREKTLLRELLRVSRLGLALFEPSWELGNAEQQSRMEQHGYIRNLPYIIQELGAHLTCHELLKNQLSLNNATAAFIVSKNATCQNTPHFVDPVTKTPLALHDENFLFSEQSGRVYPIIRGIPVLRKECSVLATHFGNEE